MTILTRVWYILFQLFRFLVEIWVLIFFINGFIFSNDREDRFLGIELDTKNENIFFIFRFANKYILGSYSIIKDSTSIHAYAPKNKEWAFPAISPLDNEIAFGEYDLIEMEGGCIKIYDFNAKSITDSIHRFNTNPVFQVFFNSKDRILFIADGFDSPNVIYEYNRITRIYNKISKGNQVVHRLQRLINFKNDSLLFLGISSEPIISQLYKIGINDPDSFIRVISLDDTIPLKDRCYLLNSVYCSSKNKLFLACFSDLYELNLENSELRLLYKAKDDLIWIDDIEVSTDCSMLYFTKSKGVHSIYRFDIENQALMPPIELRYPAKMID